MTGKAAGRRVQRLAFLVFTVEANTKNMLGRCVLWVLLPLVQPAARENYSVSSFPPTIGLPPTRGNNRGLETLLADTMRNAPQSRSTFSLSTSSSTITTVARSWKQLPASQITVQSFSGFGKASQSLKLKIDIASTRQSQSAGQKHLQASSNI